MPPRFLKTNTTKASSSTNLLFTTMSISKFSSAAAPAAVGASLRSPMRLTGCCCRATRTPDQQHCSTTKELLLWWVGLRCARQCALRGAAAGGSCCCYAKAGTAEGRAHKKTTTAAQQKSCFFGVGLRCARRSPWEEESPRRPNSRTAEQPEQLPPLPSASPSPVRFRPLPSGFPVRIRLKLLIITANYLPGSSPFFFAAAVLPPPLRE